MRPFRRAEQRRLRAEGSAAIAEAVIPAYPKLLTFYRDEYLPQARKTLGARGDARRQRLLPRSKSANIRRSISPPEEIHQIGLKEVARIDAEMRKTMARSRLQGHASPTSRNSCAPTRNSSPSTPDELMGVSSYVAKRVDGKLADYFGLLPRRRFAHQSRCPTRSRPSTPRAAAGSIAAR